VLVSMIGFGTDVVVVVVVRVEKSVVVTGGIVIVAGVGHANGSETVEVTYGVWKIAPFLVTVDVAIQ